MTLRPTSICGLDIRKDAICMALYSPETQAVTIVGVKPLDESQGDWWKTMQAGMKELVGECELSGMHAACSLPSEWAVVKHISIDKDEDGIEDVVRWEMSQQVLGSIDQYALDYQEVAGSGGCNRYLAVAYRNDAVKRLSDVMRANRMTPVVVDLDIFGLVNVFEFNYGERAAVPSAIVAGERDHTTIVLTKGGTLVDYEIVKHPFDLSRVAGYLQAVAAGLADLQRAHPDFFGGGNVATYLAGLAFSHPEVAQQMGYTVPGAEILYPFRRIAFQVGNVQDADLKKYAPQLAAAVGLGVRGGLELAG